jgi:Sigma-70 region 2
VPGRDWSASSLKCESIRDVRMPMARSHHGETNVSPIDPGLHGRAVLLSLDRGDSYLFVAAACFRRAAGISHPNKRAALRDIGREYLNQVRSLSQKHEYSPHGQGFDHAALDPELHPKDNVMASAPALSIITAQSGLSRYFEERRFPLLEPHEEFMLAKHWRERGDNDADNRLITSHLCLVAKIAAGYRGYGLPAAEIIAEGNLGLMQAVKRFEPERAFRLATYAIWWIRASIQDYVLRSWSAVKWAPPSTRRSCSSTCARLRAGSPRWRRAIWA